MAVAPPVAKVANIKGMAAAANTAASNRSQVKVRVPRGPGSGNQRQAYQAAQHNMAAETAATNAALKGNANHTTGVTKPTYDPLAPLTPQQIAAQAHGIVNGEYKGQFADLTNQATQAKNLDAKRAADQLTYNNWLASQGAALQAANANIMGHLEQTNQAIAGTANSMLSGQLTNELGQTATPGGANAMLLNAEGAADRGLVANATQDSSTHAGIGAGALGSTIANSFARQSQVRSQQVADLDKTLATLASERATLADSQRGDLAKTIYQMQQNEQSKALNAQTAAERAREFNVSNSERAREYNTTTSINQREYQQNYDQAVTKTNLAIQQQAAALGEKTRLDNANLGLKKGALDVQATNAQTSRINARTRAQQVADESKINWTKLGEQKSKDAREYQLNVAKLGLAKAKLQYTESHPPKRARGTGQPQNALSQHEMNSTFNSIDGARSQIAQLIAKGVPPLQALKYMSEGYTQGSGKGSRYVKPYGGSRIELNAAYNLATAGHINASQVALLNREGVYGVRARYPVR